MATCLNEDGHYLDGTGEDITSVLHRLRSVPNLFQLDNYQRLSKIKLNRLLDHLTTEREDGYTTPMEQIYVTNFIAFLHFHLDDLQTALTETERSLCLDQHNLVALANLAVMNWKKGDKAASDANIAFLLNYQSKAGFEEMAIDARAQMAYCYSRMGAHFATRAVELYEEVVSKRPNESVWKVGLALILRRFAHMSYRMIYPAEDVIQKSKRSCQLLQDVLNGSGTDGIKALAAIELTLLLNRRKFHVLGEGIDSSSLESPEWYAEKALSLAPEYVYELTKAGQFFGQIRKTERSKEVLEKAVRIRHTTMAYHYLGITYRTLAILDKLNRSPSRNAAATRSNGQSSRRYHRRSAARYQGSNKRWGRKLFLHVSPQDRGVQETIDSFTRSVDISHGQNFAAIIDLGCMYLSLNELNEALLYFLRAVEFTNDISPTITAYNYIGLIYLDQSRSESDMSHKDELKFMGQIMIHSAFGLLCHVIANVPAFQDIQTSLFLFMQVVRRKTHSSKLVREELQLLDMMKDYKTYYNLIILDDVCKYSQHNSSNPDFLERKLKEYIEKQKLIDAVSYCSLLSVVEQGRLFSGSCALIHNALKAHILAARQQLLQAIVISSNSAFPDEVKPKQKPVLIRLAMQTFQWAFEIKHPVSGQDRMDINRWDISEGGSRYQHVEILCHPDNSRKKDKAECLRSLLENIYGLHVKENANDAHAFLQNEHSPCQLRIILVGEHAPTTEYIVNRSGLPMTSSSLPREANQQNTDYVILYTNESIHEATDLPQNIRRMCYPHVLQRFSCSPDNLTEEAVDAICELFCFFLDVNIDI